MDGRPEAVTPEFVRECFDANELGDGTLYAALNRGRVVFNADTKDSWLYYDGVSWHIDRNNAISLAMVERVVEAYAEEVVLLKEKIAILKATGEDDTAKIIQKRVDNFKYRIGKLRSVRGRANCLVFARSNASPLTIGYNDLDQNPMLLGCKNGVIDLETGRLLSSKSEYYISKASPVEFKGIDEPCPMWEAFLASAIDDPEVVAFLQKLLGYAITGLTDLHIFPILFGRRGQNGKGTIMEIIYHILGPLAGPIQSEMLLMQHNSRSSSGPSPDIMDLMGKRIAGASETEEGQRFAVAKVKLLSGGDMLVGRNPNDRDQTTFKPTHTLFMLTNSEPHAPAHDSAFWLRVIQIDFPFTFCADPKAAWEKKAIPGLAEKLKSEASGILAWMVKGTLLWRMDGLKPPPQIAKTTAEYRRREDQLLDFLEECCVQDAGISTKSTELYDLFKKWWRARVSPRIPSHTSFGTMMHDRFERSKSHGVYKYFGVGIMDGRFDFESE